MKVEEYNITDETIFQAIGLRLFEFLNVMLGSPKIVADSLKGYSDIEIDRTKKYPVHGISLINIFINNYETIEEYTEWTNQDCLAYAIIIRSFYEEINNDDLNLLLFLLAVKKLFEKTDTDYNTNEMLIINVKLAINEALRDIVNM